MHIVIIGNGIAGTTAARHIRKIDNQSRITIISAESKHFFSRTALMYVYMGHMEFKHIKPYEDWFWSKNRLTLLEDYVTSVDTQNQELNLRKSGNLPYDKLIIATGSQPNMANWPGSKLQGVQGLYSLQDLQKMEAAAASTKHAVVVGGGLIGIEMAEMLHSRCISVSLLVRETSYWNNVLPAGESAMVNREIEEHGIDLQLSTELDEILADASGGKVRGIRTTAGKEIACQFVGVSIGVKPNIGFLEGSGIACKRGVLVNEKLETSAPNVYAIGDCAQFGQPLPGRAPIEQVWYTGRMQGETVAQTIGGNPTPYQPGPWFNSAKFFNIEYQTYGDMPPILGGNLDEVYWEHPKGKKAIHIVFEKDSRIFVGINAMGIRYRHEKFDAWLKQKATVMEVLEKLASANFDPELFPTHEKQLIEQYNQQNPAYTVQPKRKKRLLERLGFYK